MVRDSVVIRLPDWVGGFLEETPAPEMDPESRMRFVLELGRRHVLAGTGGPFAAAVFLPGSREPLSVGVNRVVAESCSSAHAEVMALSLAQQEVGDFDLSAPGLPSATLVVTAEPCAMCLGAVCWSGVREVVVSTRSPDVESIVGFDEGPRPANCRAALAERGIGFSGDVCREEGLNLLQLYVERGGVVYNASGGGAAPAATE